MAVLRFPLLGVLLVAMATATSLCIPPRLVALEAGDILVVDRDGGGATQFGGLFVVDPDTGSRVVLSDFGNSAQGPLGVDPVGVAVGGPLTVFVIDQQAGTGQLGALFRVDPVTGTRIVLSDFGASAQGSLGAQPVALAVEASGRILVVDEGVGTGLRGVLFAVAAATGARTVLSDFGNAGSGALGDSPIAVAIATTGEVLVLTDRGGTGDRGVLFRINATTGMRTALSDFGNAAQGAVGPSTSGLHVSTAGEILALDFDGGTNGRGTLYRVHPVTGMRTVLSDLGDAASGPVGDRPEDIATDAAGRGLIVDGDLGTAARGAVSRVDLATGARTLLSDFGLPGQGLLGQTPSESRRFATPTRSSPTASSKLAAACKGV